MLGIKHYKVLEKINGTKDRKTKSLIDLDATLIQSINCNKIVVFSHESIPDLPSEHVTISFKHK